MSRRIRFGVKSLDSLFGIPEGETSPGIALDKNEVTALSIAGPAGSGKSILALHLASTYKIENPTAPVLYFSTDMSVERARGYWSSFRLNSKGRYDDPTDFLLDFPHSSSDGIDIRLKDWNAGELHKLLSLADGNEDSLFGRAVHLIDLKSTTSGDDWLTLSRVGTLLGGIQKEGEPRPLIVVDAVEGLLLMGGETDLYGTKRTRRERIAQLSRVMSSSCHLCVLLEDPYASVALDEEFVVDTVVRIREREYNKYSQRTIEIPKCRGQRPIRGEHTFLIRGAAGSMTGVFANPDHPSISHSYLLVAGSIDSRAASIREAVQTFQSCAGTELDSTTAKFNIKGLDSMLHVDGGLPKGSVTALIGGEGTHRSRLGRALLAEGIYQSGTAVLLDYKLYSDLPSRIKAHYGSDPEKRCESANFKSFDQEYSPSNVQQIAKSSAKPLAKTLVYRRMDEQGTTASGMCHVVQQMILRGLVNLARQKYTKKKELDKALESLKRFPNETIRCAGDLVFVLDDLSSLRKMYPDAERNQLFLPFLTSLLKRAGVTALIIDTQCGSPGQVQGTQVYNDLQAFTDYQIFTWPVRFSGESRVAISVVPPISDQIRTRVREVKGVGRSREELIVDPHFELYRSLDGPEPELSPLSVYFLADGTGLKKYLDDVEIVLRYSTGAHDSPEPILRFNAMGEYEQVLSLLHLTPPALALKGTTIVQVDQWWVNVQRHGINPQELADSSSKISELFLKIPNLPSDEASDLLLGDRSPDNEVLEGSGLGPVMDQANRRLVPYYWSFPFLLINHRAWERARERFGSLLGRGNFQDEGIKQCNGISANIRYSNTRKEGLKCLLDFTNHLFPDVVPAGSPKVQTLSWLPFLSACSLVASVDRGDARTEDISAFEIDLTGVESLNTTVLEIWFSTLVELTSGGCQKTAAKAVRQLAEEKGLASLISTPEGSNEDTVTLGALALYIALVAIAETVNIKDIPPVEDGLDLGVNVAENRSAATRHWYGTAVEAMRRSDADKVLVPMHLPGCFGVRGDWYLAALRQSRSEYQAQLALSALTSSRSARTRLQEGVGLPFVLLTEGGSSGDRGLRSALPRMQEGRTSFYPYKVIKLMAPLEGNLESCSGLIPIWRSAIPFYDFQSRALRKWIYRNLVALDQLRDSHGRDWMPFEYVYDAVLDFCSKENDLTANTLVDMNEIKVRWPSNPVTPGAHEGQAGSLSNYKSIREYFRPLLGLLAKELKENANDGQQLE